MKKNKKSKGASKKRDLKPVRRASIPDEVVQRYRKVLKAYSKGRSLSASCAKVEVDRNTVVYNAPVAELAIAAPKKYEELKQLHSRKDKLGDFTKKCINAISSNSAIENKIKDLKKSGQLIPIGKTTD
ncbi:unnamed protein product [Knipowitschia caucasica]